MTTGPLRWGVAGAGKISHDFCTAVRSLFPGDHQFVAVAARTLEAAQQFATTHSIPKAYGGNDYEDLAQDQDVQVVYVGAVDSVHHTIGRRMLEAGKHVLIEKPLTVNERLSRELTDLARARGLFLMEAIWSRFLPAYDFAREQIRSGAIGDVVHVQGTLGKRVEPLERICRFPGSGSILAMGVYPLNGVLFLAYPGLVPDQIVAGGLLSEHGLDECMSAILLFPGRRTAVVSSDIRADHPNTLNIIGTKGILTVEAPFWCPEAVTVNGVRHEFKFPAAAAGMLPFNYDNSIGLAYEAEEVRRCLAAGRTESEVLPHEDSLRIARIQDEIRRQLGVNLPEDVQ